MIDPRWITAGLFFAAAVLGTLSLALVMELVRGWRRRRRVTRRLRPVLSDRASAGSSRDVHDLLITDRDEAGTLADLLPGVTNLKTLLEQARVDWSPWTFFLLSGGFAFGIGGVVFLVWNMLPVSTLAAVLGASGPYMYLLRKQRARFKRFEEEFPEAIDLLTRAIRAGHPLSSGIQMVADEGPEEVAEEFRRTFEEQRFGIPFEEALLGMVDRTDLVDVRIFAIAVLVQREVGGNLAEILEGLARTIRRRFYLRRQLRVYTAQGRMTGYALVSLPIVVGFVVFLLQPSYIMVLFENPVGWLLLAIAAVLQVVGGLWIRQIINIDM